ncbi:MAG: Ribosome-binding ATPase YchF [Alphaproteobacteria bacterium MarineAlpha5_Bin11]|nr:redox-regulated ATPase YchF [Pelagibacteraceae bacterium]PPR43949.1 MAG: Ribosome-binding ATPase YchF [Alphaproteobacteria bacterium MarineAlpha5_Bin11]PPR50474.1 MAG: Ribosome-binding ATPase YchF [Alphaproteobacteria bacterium MarineAlpha5_Bin10]|tara:strand:+ start:8849 stop:9949 length:1101 start_codon:yes stop_codon:yes gene_type:complete
MGVNCGIIGLPNVGKSTLFNALTQSNNAEAANYPFATIEPNIGKVAVPDERINKLTKINKSIKTIPTFMEFVDIAGLVKDASKGEGLGNKFLSHIREVDAIIHVVRCFKDSKIAHISNDIKPMNDINIIKTELLLADLEVLEKKKVVLSKKIKSGEKKSVDSMNMINDLVAKIQNEEGVNLNDYNDNQKKEFGELNLISLKPLLYVCNVDETSAVNGNDLSKMVEELAQSEGNMCVSISASIESQIADFKNQEERNVLLKDLKLNEPALNKVIKYGYDLLELITFFTSGHKETRAWTINKGTKSPQAAGKIHSDFEKGFIRAETISFKDYLEFNGEAGCRDSGKLRQEGKDYIVKDGDVMHFLYNV